MAETSNKSDNYDDRDRFEERRRAAERAAVRHEELVQGRASREDIERARDDRQRMNEELIRYGIEKGFIQEPPAAEQPIPGSPINPDGQP